MNQRREEKEVNPFLGLQASVFQRKKPLPPIKTEIKQKPSKIPIRVSRTTNKYEKLPEINKQKEYIKLAEEHGQNKHENPEELSLQSKFHQLQEKSKLNSTTDFSQIYNDDAMYTDSMATKKNIQTHAKTLKNTIDCFESHEPEFDGNALERSDRGTKRQKIVDFENTTLEFMNNGKYQIKALESSVPGFHQQRRRDISVNRTNIKEEQYSNIPKNFYHKREPDFEFDRRFRKRYTKSHPDHFQNQEDQHLFDYESHYHQRHHQHHQRYHNDHDYHQHQYQWLQPTVRQEQQHHQKLKKSSRESVLFEHSLLSKRTSTTLLEENTGIPCKPKLHKLHIL